MVAKKTGRGGFGSPPPPRRPPPPGGPSAGSTCRQRRLREALALIRSHLDYDQLWDHQRRALNALSARFQVAIDTPNAIIEIPPAGGKTRIFAHILEAFGRIPSKTRRASIVIAPTKNLVRSHLAELHRLGIKAQDGWPNIGRGPVHVMTYDRFQKAVNLKVMTPKDIDLVILADAHRGLSNKRSRGLQTFEFECPIIAFTATPGYEDRTLYDTLGKGDTEVFRISSSELRNARVTAPIINYLLKVSLTGTLPKDAKRREVIINNAARASMINFYRTFEDPEQPFVLRTKRYIGFHPTCDDAQLATDSFNAIRGADDLPSRTVTGHDSDALQQDSIDALRRGDVMGLNNAIVFVEGPNFPNVGAVLNFASTSSRVREIQRCGRAMAMNPDLPVDSPEQISAVVDLFVEINGRVVGDPRFYFEAVKDESIARIVTQGHRNWQDYDRPNGAGGGAAPGSGPNPEKPAITGISGSPGSRKRDLTPAYEVSSSLAAIHYLLAERDRYAQWKTVAEILAKMPRASRSRADYVFGTVEAALDGLTEGEHHQIGIETSTLTAGRRLRDGVDETVFDPADSPVLLRLLDHPDPDKLGDLWMTLATVIGPHADQATRDRIAQFTEDFLASRRRGEDCVRHCLGQAFLPPIVAKYLWVDGEAQVAIHVNDWKRVQDFLEGRKP